VASKGQDPGIKFFDSLADKRNQHKIILLFTELLDTIDPQTGNKLLQKNSYYYDWGAKELRYIDVYKFDKIVKKRVIKRAFKKNKPIPPATRITYTFFRNNLAKVKFVPSDNQCKQCLVEYYFVDDIMVSKTEHFSFESNRKFVDDATFFMERLQIPKKGNNLFTKGN
jgi:hypothetical protein